MSRKPYPSMTDEEWNSSEAPYLALVYSSRHPSDATASREVFNALEEWQLWQGCRLSESGGAASKV
jgi:hypothetical protein